MPRQWQIYSGQGVALEFEWDSRQLDVWLNNKVETALTRALRLAGNQAIRAQQKRSVAHVTGRKYVRENEAKDAQPLIFPGRKAALRALVWRQDVSGKPMAVARFPHIATKRGVSVRINRGAGTKRIRSAFLAHVKAGNSGKTHYGVFRRAGKKRLPIHELWTTRISDAMQDSGTIDGVQAAAMKRFDSAFERGMARELEKLRAKGDL